VENPNKTENQLKDELIKARQRITKLEKLKNKYKSAEERIKLLNSTLKAIQNINQLIVREKNRDILMQKTCDILIKAKSYHAVWFGLLRENGTFVTVKGSGSGEDISFFSKQLMDGNYPNCIINAFSKRDLLMIVDKSKTCRDCYFKNAGAGKAAVILRVEYNNRLFGLLDIYLVPDLYIRAEEEKLLKEVAGDLAYALHKLELEKEYKQAEEELRKERDFNKTLIQTSPVFFVAINAEGKTLMVNSTMLKTLGYISEEVVGKDYLSTFIPKEDRAKLSQVFQELTIDNVPTLNENWIVAKNGEKLLVEWHRRPMFKINGDFDYFFGVGIDITARKQAEEKIEKLQSLRNTISSINQLLVRVKSESELFQQTCNLLIKGKDIKFAWIGLTNNEDFNVKPVAQAGFKKGYLSSIKITWDDSKYGNGPTGIALKTFQPFIMRNIEDDPKFKPWKNDALRRGYLSSVALPLIHEEETVGILNVYSGIKDAFTNEEVKFLKEVSEDITIGIRSLRLELKLQQSYKKLQKTMEGTINIVAKIVETRDPYTAGHQLKVSKLATAIAREMKLPPDKIEGIRIASLVHDIGKISIPAEILSKPTKLNEIEYSLIKDHSQIGYDILKTIDFPWPVAKIVIQHHEKINGSGYPQSLKDNKILLEARIMGVADVVEAMSSHRPYRPALGLDKALEEISQNKGILYDPEVVDTCIKLFKEKGFKF
jgi:PAS domain S-box-containing protein/putative nucleotidyltransferase with HDIG domain